MNIFTAINRQTIDLIKPDSRWLVVCHNRYDATETATAMQHSRGEGWVRRSNPLLVSYGDGAAVYFLLSSDRIDKFMGRRFDGIVLHNCDVPLEVLKLLERSLVQSDPIEPKPIAEHEEFAMAADLLEERGMDRAAKALRGCLQLIALSKRAWLDSLTSTVHGRLRHTDAVDAMSFASLYLQQPARVTCDHRWEFNESESSRKCSICGDVQVSTPLARNQPCGGVCAVNEHNRRCRLCGWSVRDAEIWRNEQERKFIQVTK